jgi:Protein of unknown function (DUF4230)
MTRLIIAAVACFTVLGLAVFAGYLVGRPGPTAGITIWSTGPTVTHIESLGELVATSVSISDVLMAEGKGYRGSWLVRGDALISIDLTRARVAEVDRQSRTARVVLPSPHVLQARVDHERTKTWNVEKMTWIPWKGEPDALRDEAMLNAQRLVELAAGSDDHIRQAKASAAKVMSSLYRALDWNVKVEWEAAKPPAESGGAARGPS